MALPTERSSCRLQPPRQRQRTREPSCARPLRRRHRGLRPHLHPPTMRRSRRCPRPSLPTPSRAAADPTWWRRRLQESTFPPSACRARPNRARSGHGFRSSSSGSWRPSSSEAPRRRSPSTPSRAGTTTQIRPSRSSPRPSRASCRRTRRRAPARTLRPRTGPLIHPLRRGDHVVLAGRAGRTIALSGRERQARALRAEHIDPRGERPRSFVVRAQTGPGSSSTRRGARGARGRSARGRSG